MKTIEKVHFNQTICICAPWRFIKGENASMKFHTIEGSSANQTSITIVVHLNCEKEEEIIPFIDNTLDKLKESSKNASEENKLILSGYVDYMNKLKVNLSNPLLKHDLPEELKDHLMFTNSLQSETPYVFISGVGRIVEK